MASRTWKIPWRRDPVSARSSMIARTGAASRATITIPATATTHPIRRAVWWTIPRRGEVGSSWPIADSSEAKSREVPQPASTRPTIEAVGDDAARPVRMSFTMAFSGGKISPTFATISSRAAGSVRNRPARPLANSASGISAKTELKAIPAASRPPSAAPKRSITRTARTAIGQRRTVATIAPTRSPMPVRSGGEASPPSPVSPGSPRTGPAGGRSRGRAADLRSAPAPRRGGRSADRPA